jgi:hypothetical protein
LVVGRELAALRQSAARWDLAELRRPVAGLKAVERVAWSTLEALSQPGAARW